MNPEPIKVLLQKQRKEALLNKQKEKLVIVGLILAEIKQYEIDKRLDADEEVIMGLLDKMLKQRRDSLSQFKEAQREDKVSEAQYEIDYIQSFLPVQLSEAEIDTLIAQAITSLSITHSKDMGKIIEHIRPQLKGRADMRLVSEMIKNKLSHLNS